MAHEQTKVKTAVSMPRMIQARKGAARQNNMTRPPPAEWQSTFVTEKESKKGGKEKKKQKGKERNTHGADRIPPRQAGAL